MPAVEVAGVRPGDTLNGYARLDAKQQRVAGRIWFVQRGKNVARARDVPLLDNAAQAPLALVGHRVLTRRCWFVAWLPCAIVRQPDAHLHPLSTIGGDDAQVPDDPRHATEVGG